MFTGLNGAGKTSVLDAVHILGTGKSFTTSQLSKAIRDEQPGLQVVGRMKYGGAESVIGIRRLRAGGGETRLSGAPVKALSELARELPLVLLNADSLECAQGGPRGAAATDRSNGVPRGTFVYLVVAAISSGLETTQYSASKDAQR